MREPAVPNGLVDPDLLTDADDPEHLLHKQARLSELLQLIHASKSDIHNYQAVSTNGKLSLDIDFEETAYSALLSSLSRDPDLAPWFDLTDSDNEVSFVEAAQAFAHERTSGFNASLRSREIADLDSASKTDGYVLVTGGGGLGKTSLVSQAYLTASEVGDRKVVGAFVGGMRGTGSSHELLTNLVRSLSDDPPETEMTKLAEQFLSALHTAKPLMFLDGLDQLSDVGRLSWLPYGLPTGVTVVVSTMDHTLAQPFRDRGAEEIRVDALSLVDARTVLLGHLHRYRKVLEPRQVDALLSKADATSPLYLACVAEELRTLGVREELDKHIAAMPPDVGGLFLWVLRRLETDRQFRWVDGAMKVRLLLSCLGVSRDGLSESELRGLVDDASGDVAVLLRLLRPYLSRRGGLLSLHHRAHGEALHGVGIGEESRRLLGDDHPGYLDEESEVDAAREVLATYFDVTESNGAFERQAYEWPHQLFHLKAWERLERCLLTREIFEYLSVDERKWELTSYWHPLRAEPLSLDMGALYLEAFEGWRTGNGRFNAYLESRLGSFLNANGLHDSAEPLLHRVLAACERILGPEHPDTLGSVFNLANLLSDKGDLKGAEPLYRRALAAREHTLGPEHPDTLSSVSGMATLLVSKGDLVDAEPLFRRSWAARVRTLGSEHPDTLRSENNLANLLVEKGDFTGAEPLYRHALVARERTLGQEHPDTLSSLNSLANLHMSKGDLVSAESLHRRALQARERVLGLEHPQTLTSLNNLCLLLKNKGDLAGAEPLYRRALESFERLLGLDHPLTLSSVNNLANLLSDKGDLMGAEPLYHRALAARERTLGPVHPYTLRSVNNLANLLKAKGDLVSAEPLHRRALQAFERTLGPEHPDTLSSVNNLAMLLHSKGDFAGGEQLYHRALEAFERSLGPEHPATLKCVANLAMLLKAKGDLSGAEPFYRRAMEVFERTLGPEHPYTISSVNNLATLLESKGDLAGAAQLYLRALEAFERTLGPEHPHTIGTIYNLGSLREMQGDLDEAIILFRRELELCERVHGMEHVSTLSSVANLGHLLKNKGDLTGAEPLYRRALESRERTLGAEHPDTLKSRRRLEWLLETRRIVEAISGRSECNHCLGTGFVSNSDIVRLEMQSELKPGPCQLCREASGLDEKN
jgi:tetratricopeptide (TPR) repeat protein